MNKARRHELKMLHYAKRRKRYRMDTGNFYALRSHSTPCSCSLCDVHKWGQQHHSALRRTPVDDE